MADVTKTLKDAAYVVVGFGVLSFQKAQVRRRELQEQLDAQRQQLVKLATDIEQRFQPVVDEIEGRLDELETRLPEQARGLVHQARTLAKDAQQQLRSTYAAA
jgi:paraquat-inducible protein B